MADPPSPTLSESGSAAGRPGEKRAREPSPTTARKTHVRRKIPAGPPHSLPKVNVLIKCNCRSSRIFFCGCDPRGARRNEKRELQKANQLPTISGIEERLHCVGTLTRVVGTWAAAQKSENYRPPRIPLPAGNFTRSTGV